MVGVVLAALLGGGVAAHALTMGPRLAGSCLGRAATLGRVVAPLLCANEPPSSPSPGDTDWDMAWQKFSVASASEGGEQSTNVTADSGASAGKGDDPAASVADGAGAAIGGQGEGGTSTGVEADAADADGADAAPEQGDPFWLAPPSRRDVDEEGGGTFRLAPPSAERLGDPDRGRGQESLLSVFANDKGLLAGIGVLGLVLCFYVFVFASGGITDGSERFGNPETLTETLARDPDYKPPLRTWSPAAPLMYTEEDPSFWSTTGAKR